MTATQPRSELAQEMRPSKPSAPAQWLIGDAPVPYVHAVTAMNARADAIASGRAAELIWLIEHPPLYTAGTRASADQLLDTKLPVFASGRGGQFTYHGPGQRVCYVMLDLGRRTPDIRRFVATLEQWLIDTVAAFGVHGERRDDRVGVWVRRPDKHPQAEDKIAALGIRVRRFVTLHGVSLNIDPELRHFAGIVPCGVADPNYGVTSLADLGIRVTMTEVDVVLRRTFERLFGPTEVTTDWPELAETEAATPEW